MLWVNRRASVNLGSCSSYDRWKPYGIVGMLVFIPLLSVFYTIFREFVYLRLKKKHIKQVTKTEIEEYTVEETRQTHE